MNAPAECLVAASGVALSNYNHPSCLIYGIGNVGRQDDGLGWAFIDWLESKSLCPRAEITRHYQLHLEDADLISRKSRVLFVDATKDPAVEQFWLERVQPKMDFSFTSHAISIPSIMATCEQCFGRLPEVHLLTIRGYAWELEEGLTPTARQNLEAATEQIAAIPVSK
ncbi:MAG: hydrogenase maturation protease [Candidatus Polarisedimenticolaceae bacterium]|nr:hydrogenase maturation protease [Candidatus Polarisedimenticolaceae bacterium]